MSLARILRPGLLATLPWYLAASPVQAQQPTTPPASSHWYLGPQIGAQLRTYSVGRMGSGLATRFVGLRGGYALTEQLAIETGVQYGRGDRPDEALRGSGQFAYYPQTTRITRDWVVPAALRWSLARTPHRFSVSALVGTSLHFFQLRETGTNTATGDKIVQTANGVNGYLDFGFGAQLRASRRLGVTLDVLPNLSLHRPVNSYWPISPGLNTALTVNYRLN